MSSFYKICLVGAESTGKTTLALELAHALRAGGAWAQMLPETVRLFSQRWGRVPLLTDEALIYETQQQAEGTASQAWRHGCGAQAPSPKPGFLICDSSVLQIAFTSAWYCQDRSLIAPSLAYQHSYFKTYFLRPSVPWTPDGIQRDGPLAQARYDQDLMSFLVEHGVAHEEIKNHPPADWKFNTLARQLAAQLV